MFWIHFIGLIASVCMSWRSLLPLSDLRGVKPFLLLVAVVCTVFNALGLIDNWGRW